LDAWPKPTSSSSTISTFGAPGSSRIVGETLNLRDARGTVRVCFEALSLR